ncbi:MAG TPA: hypothetical protein VK992_01045, partial [Candidatus Caenarcaniphilales bacterium]|nr:hypothetical protein [Candidatus Caenarcaniphilales bacterium]
MKRRFALVVGLSIALVAGLVPAATLAKSPLSEGLRRLDSATVNKLRNLSDLGPASLKPRRRLTVLVELEGTSVAGAQAQALARNPARPLTPSERNAIEQRLAARQRELRPGIEAAGGNVL